MANPDDRMRLKDKIIDNISKAIKSIQSHHFLKSNSDASSFCIGNVDKPCHKLCENLDHVFLHGLKNVSHGYWPVVKQLSHKGMIKEIEMLINVTTDLGRGRAWLYASLNEGLLESYLRMLSENGKLVKKHYAKEALVLDHDRMTLLLTLITGLECVSFRLEFDQPYLDLNAYPPRTRADSDLEEFDSPRALSRTVSEDNKGRSDSESSSLASLDVHSNHQLHADVATKSTRTSTVSSDSGFPVVGGTTRELWSPDSNASSYTQCVVDNSLDVGSEGIARSVTPTGSMSSRRQRVSNAGSDSISVSSFNSTGGDIDRIQRVEHILPQGDMVEDDQDNTSLEVIRVKSKRGSATGGKGKKKKGSVSKKDKRDSRSESESKDVEVLSSTEPGSGINSDSFKNEVLYQVSDSVDSSKTLTCEERRVNNNTVVDGKADTMDSISESGGQHVIPQFNSGVDIHSLLAASEKGSPSHSSIPQELSTKHVTEEPRSAFALIENKIAELCLVSEEPEDKSISTVGVDKQTGKVGAEKSVNNVKDGKESQKVISEFSNSGNITSLDTKSYQNNSVWKTDSISSISQNQSNAKPHLSDHERGMKKSNKTSTGSQPSNGKSQGDHSEIQSFNLIGSAKPTSLDITQDITHKKDHAGEIEEDFDFYACQDSEADQGDPYTGGGKGQMSDATAKISDAHAATQLEDYMDFILQRSDSSPESHSHSTEKESEQSTDLALSLDNNTKLQVMLDIFTKEHEHFIKMFATREQHTEGEPNPVFVLVSDHCLYILQYKRARRKFVLNSSANLMDLIFVSTGLNDQTLNIESREKSRQKQRLWLTPGHQALTQAIVSCLTDAVKKANESIVSVRSRFSVGSEVPLQKIALRKYISKELNVEAQDVEINDYSLVFWEDPSSENRTQGPGATKEGTLLLRTYDPMKGYMWKPVYIVLKDSMLCVSNHKTDVRPHLYLGLGGDQCVGCRLTSTADRPHCVELVMSTGASGNTWLLSAASESEVQEWRHVLCLAVSQGMQDPNVLSQSLVPCCVVLSSGHLLMCHEDLHTKFCRTLGRAQLEDITGISVDEQEYSYCVIEFESQEAGVSSVQWVLYFAAKLDRDRHIAAVGTAWKDIYKIDLPVLPVENMSLQRQCRSHGELLRRQLSIS